MIANTNWIQRTAALAAVFALPATCLLMIVWRRGKAKSGPSNNDSLWVGFIFVVSYLAWFLNVSFEWSVAFMVVWPIFGICLGIIGCVWSWRADPDDRLELLFSNVLLLILAFASVIAPN